MPQDDATLALLLGQAAGGALGHIINSGDVSQRADMMAALFEETGHPTGNQIATVLRDNPTTGMLFVKQLGGADQVYGMLQQKMKAEGAARAQAAENAAVTNQARIYLGGLQPGGGGPGGVAPSAPSAAAPAGLSTGDYGAAAAPRAQPPGGGGLDIANLESVTAGGGDLGPVLDNIKKVRELQAEDTGSKLLSAANVDPDNYTTGSVNAFLRDLHTKSLPGYAGKDRLADFKLLKRYEKPTEAPSGYSWTASPTGAPQLAAIKGGPADLTRPGAPPPKLPDVKREVVNEYLALRRAGKPIPKPLQDAWDDAARLSFTDQILRAAGGAAGVGGAPTEPGPNDSPQPPPVSAGARPAEAPSEDPVRTQIARSLSEEFGRAPTADELDTRMRILGLGGP